MDYNTFVDIGKVTMLRCVKSASAEHNCELEAVGTKGTIRLLRWEHTLSNGHVYTEHGDLFDLGISAFLHQLSGVLSWSFTMWTHLNEGFEIPICSDFDAWEILRSETFCEFEYLIGEPLEWVDCKGVHVTEPEDFRRKLALRCVYAHLATDASVRNASVHDDILKVLRDYSIALHNTSGHADDFDFMMDWYEVTATAAWTINNHIRLGDYSPNVNKVDSFQRFLDDNIQRMEKLAGKWDYAKHLWQRKEQIGHSRANGWKTVVEEVEVYRRGRFDEM